MVQQTDIDDTMKTLSDDGYGDGPAVSPYFMLAEGDEIELNFRGNVKSSNKVSDLHQIYNSPVCTSFNFSIEIKDKCIQEQYPMYQGFVQLYKKEKKSEEKMVKDKDGNTRRETVFKTALVFLCEVLVQLPKEVRNRYEHIVSE